VQSPPALDAPHHPEQLLRALQELKDRPPPQLPDPHRLVLEEICAALAAGEQGLVAVEFGARCKANLRAWDNAARDVKVISREHEDLTRKHDDLARKHGDYIVAAGDKFVALGDLCAFIEECAHLSLPCSGCNPRCNYCRSAFPELKLLSHLINSWREKRILPDSAWALLDEEEQADRGGGGAGADAAMDGGGAGAPVQNAGRADVGRGGVDDGNTVARED